MNIDDPFDLLLSEVLAPPARPADQPFLARAQTAIAEAERFRRWRRRALRRAGSEALVLAGLAGAALSLTQVPAIGEVLSGVPLAAPAVAGMLLLGWLALGQPGSGRVIT